jgi:transmembrane sensor
VSERFDWVKDTVVAARDPSRTASQAAARARFVKAALAEREQPARPRRAVLAGVAFAAISVAVVLFALRRPPPPNAAPAQSAEASDPMRIELPDGSSFALTAGARGRVREMSATGATLVLHGGTATVEVVHRPGVSYHVLAGPYDVAVTGTTFVVSWEPAQEQLRIEMRSGVVHVTGPALGAGRDVAAGTTASFSALGGDTEATPQPSTSGERIPTPRDGAHLKPTPPPVKRAEASWRELLDRGANDDVVKSAESSGLPSVLASRDDDDLSALADAARFTGRRPLARDALLALRRRFPGSRRAHTAAFVLGKLDEESGAIRDAAGWYERYLAEAPGGALATEAAGRALLAWKKAGDPSEARRVAVTYLRRFPDGPLVGIAGETLGP